MILPFKYLANFFVREKFYEGKKCQASGVETV